MALWGIYNYLNDEGPTPLERDYGICDHCKTFVAVEVLPSQERLRAMHESILRNMQEYRVAFAQLKKSQPWWKRAMRLRPDVPWEIEGLQRSAEDHLPRSIREEEERLRLLRDRQSPPRCLQCGSTKVQQLPPSEGWYPQRDLFDYEDRPAKPIGVKHEGCGGDLMVADSAGTGYARSLPERFYDLEGNLLHACLQASRATNRRI